MMLPVIMKVNGKVNGKEEITIESAEKSIHRNLQWEITSSF